MIDLTATREALADALAGDGLTVAPEPGAAGALPSLTIRPGELWLDGQGSGQGGTPARVVRYGLTATVAVRYADPVTATDDLEGELVAVFGRVPARWNLDRVDPPHRIAGGEVDAYGADVHLSTISNLT